jgi:hypothetical protein
MEVGPQSVGWEEAEQAKEMRGESPQCFEKYTGPE